jgi:hypothetical protein
MFLWNVDVSFFIPATTCSAKLLSCVCAELFSIILDVCETIGKVKDENEISFGILELVTSNHRRGVVIYFVGPALDFVISLVIVAVVFSEPSLGLYDYFSKVFCENRNNFFFLLFAVFVGCRPMNHLYYTKTFYSAK